jgi:outer membrane receptor protein involved in Fe transport
MQTARHAFVSQLGFGSLAGAIALLLAGGGAAQESGDALEEITVTGTRIRATDGMAEPVPVTTLTVQELSLFEPGSTIAEQLDALPQFFQTSTAQRGGPALFGNGGGSYLNMRGLGPERTLVLFDGFRMPPADKRGSVNVDTFPTALMRSVDVVTGGASAAYGADALGGVTNFILDREFQGMSFSAGAGVNEFNNDGKNWNVTVAGGTEIGERLHIIGSIEARRVDQIQRDPSQLDPSWFQRWGYVLQAPGVFPQRITVPWTASAGLHVNGRIALAPGGPPGVSQLSNMVFNDDGSGIVPFDRGTVADYGCSLPAPTPANPCSWFAGGPNAEIAHRTQPGGPAGAEVVQNTGFFGVKYDISDTLDVFADVLVGHVESNQTQSVSAATMSSQWAYSVYRENAYLPESVRQIMVAENRPRFLIHKGGSYLGELDVYNTSTSRNDFDSESLRFGIDWTMSDRWDMRLSLQTGQTEKMTGVFDGLRVDRLALAVDAVEIYTDRRDETGDTGAGPPDGRPDLVAAADRGTGTIVCNVQRYNPTEAQLASASAIQGRTKTTVNGVVPVASPIGLDNSVAECVPFNIMGHGQITPAAADYILTPKWGDSVVEQDFAELLFRGELSDGWGAGPLSLATGLTYRDQSFNDGAYPVEIDALGPPVNADGSPGFTPNLGIRGIAAAWAGGSPNLHQFSTVSAISGGYDVWEAFGELNVPIWQSSSAERHFGTSFAYRTSDYSNVGGFDTWKAGLDFQLYRDLRLRATRSHDVREATFSERFDNSPTGGTVNDPAFNDTPAVITVTSAGNPNLEPEQAETTVVGFVYEPSWADGLRMSIDAYEVDISDSIATLGAQRVVDECYDNNVLCDLVVRNDQGVLTRVFSPYLNLDSARVKGVDFEFFYARDVDWLPRRGESLSIRALGGKLNERTNTVAGSQPAEFAGSRGFPDLTGNVTLSYRVDRWTVQLQERFVDEVLLNRLWVEGVQIDDNTIPSRAWTNLVLGWNGEMSERGSWRITLNVQNLFDKDPPIIPQSGDTRFGAQGTDALYDEFGRRYQLGFNMEF